MCIVIIGIILLRAGAETTNLTESAVQYMMCVVISVILLRFKIAYRGFLD
jgi:hypothetical protein